MFGVLLPIALHYLSCDLLLEPSFFLGNGSGQTSSPPMEDETL